MIGALVLRCRSYFLYVLLLSSILTNFALIFPYYLPRSEDHFSEPSVKVVSVNLNRFNEEKHLFHEYISEADPDVLLLFELTPEWAEQVSTLNKVFPYAKAVVQVDNFGIGVISKQPLRNTKVFREEILGPPLLMTDTTIRGQEMKIIAAHPFPPIDRVATASRNQYIKQISEYVKESSGPVLVCGDLNATPWSSALTEILRHSQLTIPKGFGIVSTWPTQLPLLRLPVDHCLVPEGTYVMSYKRGPYIGSDHYPLEMELQIPSDRWPTSDKDKFESGGSGRN